MFDLDKDDGVALEMHTNDTHTYGLFDLLERNKNKNNGHLAKVTSGWMDWRGSLLSCSLTLKGDVVWTKGCRHSLPGCIWDTLRPIGGENYEDVDDYGLW